MYSNKSKSNTSHNENKRKRYTRKRSHVPNGRNHKHSKSSQEREEHQVSIRNVHLKHANTTSDYIGQERLTKRMGFLNKGKISDSISRLEKSMPKSFKVRAQKDLEKVLKFSDDSQLLSPDKAQIYTSDSNSPRSLNSPQITVKSTSHRKQNKGHSDKSLDQDSMFASVRIPTPRSIPSSRCKTELQISTETLKKMHNAVKRTNDSVFSDVYNQDKIKKELLDLRKQYKATRIVSASSNCESSQDNGSVKYIERDDFVLNPVTSDILKEDFEFNFKDNFELNPVLTQKSNTHQELETMFPDTRNLSTSSDSSSEDSIVVTKLIWPQNNNIRFKPDSVPNKPSCTSGSEVENSSFFIPDSPTSSSDSPVWRLNVSPVKFVPTHAPSPKLYYRQKMF